MQTAPGLRGETWTSGIDTRSVGGFHESDSVARAHAECMPAGFANAADAGVTATLFDDDMAAEASRGMSSPFHAAGGAAMPGRGRHRRPGARRP